ncbi:MAG: hypothetical protein IPP61_07765 [Cytophagaceae bacterium]|nr:hypothetical protein [Cytophagaceae bacterium]MBL0302234.1 hypothetical protein [Cytophagaceae bacterium]MBL0325060.1 hypothetical protein [Cytophagaceae bacterium]
MKKWNWVFILIIFFGLSSCGNILKPGGVKFELTNQADVDITDFTLSVNDAADSSGTQMIEIAKVEVTEVQSFSLDQDQISAYSDGYYSVSYVKNKVSYKKNFGKITNGEDMSASGFYLINVLPTYVFIGED